MRTETLETGKYTRMELFWEVCRYRSQLVGEPPSDRTFRYWRQKLEIHPEPHTGLYWQSDLERLKTAVRLISQGHNLDQILQIFKEKPNAYFG